MPSTTVAARRNARTRYVGSPERSSSNAIFRNARTGSTCQFYRTTNTCSLPPTGPSWLIAEIAAPPETTARYSLPPTA